MKALQIIAIVFAILAFTAFLIKCIIFLWNRITYLKNDYEKVINKRLAAYQLLNKALAIASVSLKYAEHSFHGCFLSAGDYFQFKNSLSEAEKETYWYTNQTATYLKEYVELIDDKAAGLGLTMYSKDILYQEFGIKYYELFDEYQNNLLKSILFDYKAIQDVKSFMDAKDDNDNSKQSAKVLFQTIG